MCLSSHLLHRYNYNNSPPKCCFLLPRSTAKVKWGQISSWPTFNSLLIQILSKVSRGILHKVPAQWKTSNTSTCTVNNRSREIQKSGTSSYFFINCLLSHNQVTVLHLPSKWQYDKLVDIAVEENLVNIRLKGVILCKF